MMQFTGLDIKTIAYIDSENEFGRAKKKGFWQTFVGLVTGQVIRLRSFAEAVENLHSYQTNNLGLQDIPLQNIIGSVGRERDFNCCFLPRTNDGAGKDRWRRVYTLAVTGQGFPPIEVYKIGRNYFVEDGHHRVSVARHLAWDTIQAFVTELSSPLIDHDVCDEMCLRLEICS